MEPKNSKIFSKEMMQSVSAFCESKEIKDIDNFMYLCFKQGFDIRKYGLLGKTLNDGEKDLKTSGLEEKRLEIPVEVIKEVEKIIEVPVEVIREVEKIVEVPVEVIREVEKIVEVVKEIPIEKVVIKEVIKEVPVDKIIEKEVYITDDQQVNELGEKIAKLENEKETFFTKQSEFEKEREIFSIKMVDMENQLQSEIIKKDEELDEVKRNLDELKRVLEQKENNNKTTLLQETLQNLRGELQQKNEQIKELEKINRELLNGNQNQAYLLRGSNLNRRL